MRSFALQALLPPSRAGWLLGSSGLIPFVGLCALSWILEGDNQTQVLFALLAYGATILSFLGAIHWGLALREAVKPPTHLLIWGVAPSLIAWIALLLDSALGLWILAAGLWLCYAVDRREYPRFGLSNWLGFRLALTTVASVACIVAAAGNT